MSTAAEVTLSLASAGGGAVIASRAWLAKQRAKQEREAVACAHIRANWRTITAKARLNNAFWQARAAIQRESQAGGRGYGKSEGWRG